MLLERIDGLAQIIVSTDCEISAKIASSLVQRYNGEMSTLLVLT